MSSIIKQIAVLIGLVIISIICIYFWRPSGPDELKSPELKPDAYGKQNQMRGSVENRNSDSISTKSAFSTLDPDIDKFVNEKIAEADGFLKKHKDKPFPETKEEAHARQVSKMMAERGRKRYEETKKRMEEPKKAQCVYGRITFSDLFKDMVDPTSLVINAYPAPGSPHMRTQSAIIGDQFLFDPLRPGVYGICVSKTAITPEVWMHNVRVEEGQSPTELIIDLGKSSAVVKVYDEGGNPLTSSNVDIQLGGTSKVMHSVKKTTSIENGVWEVDYLFAGQYLVLARWEGKSVSKLVDMVDGNNEYVLTFENYIPPSRVPEASINPPQKK